MPEIYGFRTCSPRLSGKEKKKKTDFCRGRLNLPPTALQKGAIGIWIWLVNLTPAHQSTDGEDRVSGGGKEDLCKEISSCEGSFQGREMSSYRSCALLPHASRSKRYGFLLPVCRYTDATAAKRSNADQCICQLREG